MTIQTRSTKQHDFSSALTVALTLIFFYLHRPILNQSLQLFKLPAVDIAADIIVVWAILAFSLACFFMKGKPDAFAGLAVGLSLMIAIASLVNPGDGSVGMMLRWDNYYGPAFFAWTIDWFPLLSTILLVNAFAKTHVWELIWSMLLACVLYLCLNFGFILVTKAPIEIHAVSNLFFGFKNTTGRIAIPAFACSLLIAKRYGMKWVPLPVCVFIMSVFQFLIAYSATLVLAFAAMGIACISVIWSKPRKVLNALTYGIGYIVVFLSIVIAKVQNVLAPLLRALFNKGATLTGRTYIWDRVFEMLQGPQLLIGYGPAFYDHFIVLSDQAIRHAHNDILNILMLGGIIALICYLALYVLAIRKLFLARSSSYAAMLSIGLLGFLIVGLTEITACSGLFFILAASYYLLPRLQADDPSESGSDTTQANTAGPPSQALEA